MLENNEYEKVLETFYDKSLILENMSDFHPDLSFWFFDAMAHLDYSISLFAYNADSPRNLLSREYLKYRKDQSMQDRLSCFDGFMNWLLENHPGEYEKFPLFLQKIHDPNDMASYRSFRIVLDPNDKKPTPPAVFRVMIDEIFDKAYLASIYNGSNMAQLYTQYMNQR
ncbi:hypothetical protein KHC33_07355 [Methanospirillum sp. J.3.6.1-F.2.7.3]|jgi:hypothetical protein|uniref:Uncharacterized protein n=2 Tax=Methanospirillum TaxID=2202 RepID=A0A8E7B1J3_9EURY|nr:MULTISPECIES: hypothetical protein [Methanospirillum]MDX8550734.1 hypothetical protein [Methanospirillum hungatei]QVV90289.1 hypothetical protein KHC33_07355 [Methanospirillum sp. J.3.6.1-F.2.7.3]QXO94677.1 hypothetical protein KSK55_15430 [Methanospirillum hungatei]